MNRTGRLLTALLLAAVVVLPTARSADRDALKQIVGQCVSHWRALHQPSPCLRVYWPEGLGIADGYALLADRKGGEHFLLIPTRTVTGIESPALLAPGTPNYFAAAWRWRAQIVTSTGRAVSRDRIGLAVNAPYSRGQDQLHIHIECQGAALQRALRASAMRLSVSWIPLRVGLWHYQARRILGASLDDSDPFRLLADGLPGARADMGAYTLVVAGWQFADGPGFVLLAGKQVPGGETLLDSRCARMPD